MSENKHCHDCGGRDGHHFNGCTYEGTDGGYSSYRRGSGTIIQIDLLYTKERKK